MAPDRRVPIFLRSVRAKLLLLLAVLSLPLLIVSIYQLSNYRLILDERSEAIASIETAAAGGALSDWLRDRSSVGKPEAPSRTEIVDLYNRLEQHARPLPGSTAPGATVIAIDANGNVIDPPAEHGRVPRAGNSVAEPRDVEWTDGVVRLTTRRNIGPDGWGVIVGVPLPESAQTSHSIFMLTLTWALALTASILMAVWAVGGFTRPLRLLAASASRLGGGKLNERAVVETEDEMGSLAQGFNAMAAQLQSKFNEIHEQSAFIEEILDGLPLGVAVLDSNLVVRKLNPTFAQFMGGDAKALAGRGIYEAAAGLAVLSDVLEDVRRTRKPFVTYGLPLKFIGGEKQDAPKRQKEGFWDITIWPTSDPGSARGDLILILSEVSKRVRAEKLATSAFASEKTRAAELQSVINQMNEGVIIVDRDGRCKLNPAAVNIIGHKPAETSNWVQALSVEMALSDLSGRELSTEETPLWIAIGGRKASIGENLQVKRADGEKRVISLSATPLVGGDGQQEGAVAVFRDITEPVRQHNELVAAYARLREHDRLKSAFVSNVTHELRTPLNVIIGLSQLLRRDRELALAPLQEEAVTRMERNARALLELVNDLLDYSRLEAGSAALQLEMVNISELVGEILQDFTAETKEKLIGLRSDVSPDLGLVLTDRHKLSQVISNLVGNAVKFTSSGTIKVGAGSLEDDRWYLEVIDTGIGMSSDALTYIFDEFRQVDDRLARTYGGTGLGLAITRKIVELLEGEIHVESEPTEGSKFRIVWPLTIRQRTGTGSLVEKDVPEPVSLPGLQANVR